MVLFIKIAFGRFIGYPVLILPFLPKLLPEMLIPMHKAQPVVLGLGLNVSLVCFVLMLVFAGFGCQAVGVIMLGSALLPLETGVLVCESRLVNQIRLDYLYVVILVDVYCVVLGLRIEGWLFGNSRAEIDHVGLV